jgi:hypothetical protein
MSVCGELSREDLNSIPRGATPLKSSLSALAMGAVSICLVAAYVAPFRSRAAGFSSPQNVCPLSLDNQVREAQPDKMNPEKLRKILERIGPMITAYCPWTDGHNPYDSITDPLVSLEEFFDGNNDLGSIGPNLDSQPTPQEFYVFLKNLRSWPDVADVRILITQYDGPGIWPFSDTIFVITSASPQTVRTWIPQRFKPDEVGVDAPSDRRESVFIPAGMQTVTLWYD